MRGVNQSGNDVQLRALLKLFKSHPWHGVPIGEEAPEVVAVYVEMVPTDTIKYEIDKDTGHLRVDRPQRYSNMCPALYGFVPQTLCDAEVAARCKVHGAVEGDQDPLDVLVLTEKTFSHGDVLLKAIPSGGFRMVDRGQADDKVIAVLVDDGVFGDLRELSQIPDTLLDRLQHYFLTYKMGPHDSHRPIDIAEVYQRAEAQSVIRASRNDYDRRFPELKSILGPR